MSKPIDSTVSGPRNVALRKSNNHRRAYIFHNVHMITYSNCTNIQAAIRVKLHLKGFTVRLPCCRGFICIRVVMRCVESPESAELPHRISTRRTMDTRYPCTKRRNRSVKNNLWIWCSLSYGCADKSPASNLRVCFDLRIANIIVRLAIRQSSLALCPVPCYECYREWMIKHAAETHPARSCL